MQILRPHNSNISKDYAPIVIWKIIEDAIVFNFEFQGLDSLNTSDKFTKSFLDAPKNNWGLWEYDVFEVFISRDGINYLEVQVSPLSQNFVLSITKPRLEYKVPTKFTGKTETISTNPWCAQIIIPINEIPGKTNILTGNCFSVIGSGKREHFALNTNEESDPDFHRPDLFTKFGEIS
jgi:hypothetical protein